MDYISNWMGDHLNIFLVSLMALRLVLVHLNLFQPCYNHIRHIPFKYQKCTVSTVALVSSVELVEPEFETQMDYCFLFTDII